ncbi:DEAD/DEAH box helicase [Candidatus Woesearchaeota archaeon]|jgi:SNF2 family DNA or RNA helicase|nr:DEAD/DEAH box helicase [Candidatus Woesearchaeota archaeon]MBT5739672.1 DEAD/DEAH box helicase [Candidatus Woesearchaeota archaeon]
MAKELIETILDRYVASGKYTPERIKKVRDLLKATKKATLSQAMGEIYQENPFCEQSKFDQFVDRARLAGYWFTEEDTLNRAKDGLYKILEEASVETDTDYFSLLEDIDEDKDPELYAAFLLNIPSIRGEILKQIGNYDNLYRVARSILQDRKKKRTGPKYREDSEDPTPKSEDKEPSYQGFLRALPQDHFNSMEEDDTPENDDRKRLFLILREKAKRDCFGVFKNETDSKAALTSLEQYVNQQENSNIRFLYEDQLETYRGYLKFQEEMLALGHINSQFRHPVSGEENVLPSLHQAIAMYENLVEGKFGIFDDCGTGKTAIAALMKPLIEKKKQDNGKEVSGRVLVVGPKTSSKAWSDGLEGKIEKRYFTEKQKVAWVNGRKDEQFLEEMREADFIFVNYEQLLCDFSVNGESKKVYEVLMDLGYDQIIVDEIQEARNTRNKTKKGKETESLAVRMLATHPSIDHVSLLSGTPMPDNLDDYANILFILRPEYFMKEKEVDGVKGKKLQFDNISKRFKEIYDGDPRALYALVKERTIRRTSEEVTDLPGCERIDEYIDLTPIQRQIMDYVFEHSKKDWLVQMRYAALDPRLVSPIILQEMGLIGKVSREDSAKYNKLEEILSDVETGKVVIFSSMFAEGVTREAKRLEREYKKLGLSAEFKRLGIKTLEEDLIDHLQEKCGREVEFISIDAETKDEDRENAVDRLSNGLDGIVCTTKSGGVSLNFSAATTGIFLDQHYSPATTDQAVARIVRRGQRGKAKIHFLYGKDSIDQDVKELVDTKRENIKMSLDGVELLDKEKELLWAGKDRERLKDIILKRKGGLSIDLSNYNIDDITDFETKSVRKRKKGKSHSGVQQDFYEQTVGQEIRKVIADSPIECWHDQEFVQKYVDNFETLGPYLLARAKIADLVKRSSQKEIEFPHLFLADAAAQGILFSAFQDMRELVNEHGFEVPLVVDRDFSQPMHDLSPNPNKYLADMCGTPQVFDEVFFEQFGKFDFVDNSSITLLQNKEKFSQYMLEANRILDEGGLLQLGIGGWHFSKEFFIGMEKAGFDTVVKSKRHAVSRDLIKVLKEMFGNHYAEAYGRKLGSTTFSLFQKVDKPNLTDKKYFLLENPNYVEEVIVNDTKKPESDISLEQISPVGAGIKTVKRKEYTGKKKKIIDPKTGLVRLV